MASQSLHFLFHPIGSLCIWGLILRLKSSLLKHTRVWPQVKLQICSPWPCWSFPGQALTLQMAEHFLLGHTDFGTTCLRRHGLQNHLLNQILRLYFYRLACTGYYLHRSFYFLIYISNHIQKRFHHMETVTSLKGTSNRLADVKWPKSKLQYIIGPASKLNFNSYDAEEKNQTPFLDVNH